MKVWIAQGMFRDGSWGFPAGGRSSQLFENSPQIGYKLSVMVSVIVCNLIMVAQEHRHHLTPKT